MTYEEFLDTELCDELTDLHYEPDIDVVYGTVDHGFIYRSEYYSYGSMVAFHLDTGIIRTVWSDT